MTYTTLLIENCTVQRYTEGARDASGNPTLTWADNLTGQACRLVAAPGTELKVGAEIVVADYKLFVQDINIIEQDRVVIDSLTYEVLLVQTYANLTTDHHKQVWLRISR